MTQISILNGIFADPNGEFRTSYPRNYIPVPKAQGISQGYLRPAYGIVKHGEGDDIGRGGINWNGICYRVMGNRFVQVQSNGTVITRGSVPGTELVRMRYSFDKLAIASGGELFYWDGVNFTQNTDPDLGLVNDVLSIDGYFMTTDGKSLVITELNDPYSVNPLKYGSSEVNPDDIKCLLDLKDEVYAVNRYTTEIFENVGGDNFPFSRIKGAQLTKGSIGRRTAAVFMDAIAMVGGGFGETTSVWLGLNGNSNKISTREIDQILSEYDETVLENCLLETMVDLNHQFLIFHLPNRTLIFDGMGTQAAKEAVWFVLHSDLIEADQFQALNRYRARNLVWCYNKWLSEDPTSNNLGYYDYSKSSHYDSIVGWEFQTQIIYNASKGAIIHDLELVALPGRIQSGDPTISTSYSIDGESWSVDRFIRAGKQGERNKRWVWLQQGHMQNWRIQRFKGTSETHASVARLEATIEPLYV